MSLQILNSEITGDPLSRGYSGMTDAQIADSLNTANRPQTNTLIPAHKVVSAVVPSEAALILPEERDRIAFIVSAGEVNISSDNVRSAFQRAFAAGTTTRANLLALLNAPSISRAVELGLGVVLESDIGKARNWS